MTTVMIIALVVVVVVSHWALVNRTVTVRLTV